VKPAQFVVLCVFGMVSWLAESQAHPIDPGLLSKANAGDPAAEVFVGEGYAQAAAAAQDPEIATENWNKAAEWYIKAAAQSHVPAEIHLADCYSYGRGVPRDKVKAAEWYLKAAEQGNPGAQGTLAMLYTMGQGVAQDDAEAYFWFDLAASADTPNQERYTTNRQNVGTRITADQLAAVQQRLKKWKAAHPRPDVTK
jgi:TPR repeat protein